MSKLEGLKTLQPFEFFSWMDGYCSAFDDLPDGAWQAACEDAVAQFNKTHDTTIDPYNGWMAWIKYSARNTNGKKP